MIPPIQVFRLNFYMHFSIAMHATFPAHHLEVHQSDNIQ